MNIKFSDFINSNTNKRLLSEKQWTYDLPKDHEQLLYHFYLLASLPPNPGLLNKDLLNNIKKSEDSEEHISEVLMDYELAYYLYTFRNKLFTHLKQKLLNAVFFAVCAEIRHMFDSNSDETIRNWFKSHGKQYDTLISVYAISGGSKIKSPFINRSLLGSVDIDLSRYKEDNTNYKKSYEAVKKALLKSNLSEYDFMDICDKAYREGLSWNSSYGGPKWADICVGWMNLYKSNTQSELSVWIDRVYDLQHNTDTVFNKLKSYYKSGSGYSWILKALDFKAHAISLYQIIEKVEDSDLKSFANAVIKNVDHTSYEYWSKTLKDLNINKNLYVFSIEGKDITSYYIEQQVITDINKKYSTDLKKDKDYLISKGNISSNKVYIVFNGLATPYITVITAAFVDLTKYKNKHTKEITPTGVKVNYVYTTGEFNKIKSDLAKFIKDTLNDSIEMSITSKDDIHNMEGVETSKSEYKTLYINMGPKESSDDPQKISNYKNIYDNIQIPSSRTYISSSGKYAVSVIDLTLSYTHTQIKDLLDKCNLNNLIYTLSLDKCNLNNLIYTLSLDKKLLSYDISNDITYYNVMSYASSTTKVSDEQLINLFPTIKNKTKQKTQISPIADEVFSKIDYDKLFNKLSSSSTVLALKIITNISAEFIKKLKQIDSTQEEQIIPKLDIIYNTFNTYIIFNTDKKIDNNITSKLDASDIKITIWNCFYTANILNYNIDIKYSFLPKSNLDAEGYYLATSYANISYLKDDFSLDKQDQIDISNQILEDVDYNKFIKEYLDLNKSEIPFSIGITSKDNTKVEDILKFAQEKYGVLLFNDKIKVNSTPKTISFSIPYSKIKEFSAVTIKNILYKIYSIKDFFPNIIVGIYSILHSDYISTKAFITQYSKSKKEDKPTFKGYLLIQLSKSVFDDNQWYTNITDKLATHDIFYYSNKLENITIAKIRLDNTRFTANQIKSALSDKEILDSVNHVAVIKKEIEINTFAANIEAMSTALDKLSDIGSGDLVSLNAAAIIDMYYDKDILNKKSENIVDRLILPHYTKFVLVKFTIGTSFKELDINSLNAELINADNSLKDTLVYISDKTLISTDLDAGTSDYINKAIVILKYIPHTQDNNTFKAIKYLNNKYTDLYITTSASDNLNYILDNFSDYSNMLMKLSEYSELSSDTQKENEEAYKNNTKLDDLARKKKRSIILDTNINLDNTAELFDLIIITSKKKFNFDDYNNLSVSNYNNIISITNNSGEVYFKNNIKYIINKVGLEVGRESLSIMMTSLANNSFNDKSYLEKIVSSAKSLITVDQFIEFNKFKFDDSKKIILKSNLTPESVDLETKLNNVLNSYNNTYFSNNDVLHNSISATSYKIKTVIESETESPFKLLNIYEINNDIIDYNYLFDKLELFSANKGQYAYYTTSKSTNIKDNKQNIIKEFNNYYKIEQTLYKHAYIDHYLITTKKAVDILKSKKIISNLNKIAELNGDSVLIKLSLQYSKKIVLESIDLLLRNNNISYYCFNISKTYTIEYITKALKEDLYNISSNNALSIINSSTKLYKSTIEMLGILVPNYQKGIDTLDTTTESVANLDKVTSENIIHFIKTEVDKYTFILTSLKLPLMDNIKSIISEYASHYEDNIILNTTGNTISLKVTSAEYLLAIFEFFINWNIYAQSVAESKDSAILIGLTGFNYHSSDSTKGISFVTLETLLTNYNYHYELSSKITSLTINLEKLIKGIADNIIPSQPINSVQKDLEDSNISSDVLSSLFEYAKIYLKSNNRQVNDIIYDLAKILYEIPGSQIESTQNTSIGVSINFSKDNNTNVLTTIPTSILAIKEFLLQINWIKVSELPLIHLLNNNYNIYNFTKNIVISNGYGSITSFTANNTTYNDVYNSLENLLTTKYSDMWNKYKNVVTEIETRTSAENNLIYMTIECTEISKVLESIHIDLDTWFDYTVDDIDNTIPGKTASPSYNTNILANHKAVIAIKSSDDTKTGTEFFRGVLDLLKNISKDNNIKIICKYADIIDTPYQFTGLAKDITEYIIYDKLGYDIFEQTAKTVIFGEDTDINKSLFQKTILEDKNACIFLSLVYINSQKQVAKEFTDLINNHGSESKIFSSWSQASVTHILIIGYSNKSNSVQNYNNYLHDLIETYKDNYRELAKNTITIKTATIEGSYLQDVNTKKYIIDHLTIDKINKNDIPIVKLNINSNLYTFITNTILYLNKIDPVIIYSSRSELDKYNYFAIELYLFDYKNIFNTSYDIINTLNQIITSLFKNHTVLVNTSDKTHIKGDIIIAVEKPSKIDNKLYLKQELEKTTNTFNYKDLINAKDIGYFKRMLSKTLELKIKELDNPENYIIVDKDTHMIELISTNKLTNLFK